MATRTGFRYSLDELQQEVLDMGVSVERVIHSAVESLVRNDDKLANDVIASDDTVDKSLEHIENLCLRLIALQQPMANDLRFIGTALKISIDLERIADLAVDIAKITLRLNGEGVVKPLIYTTQMAQLAKQMLSESLISFIERDVHRASALAEMENQVDTLYSAVMSEILELMDSETVRNCKLTQFILVAHHLERVADHTTNIGEGLIYMVTGKRKDLNI